MSYMTISLAVQKIAYNISDPEHKRFPRQELYNWLEDAIREMYERTLIFEKEIVCTFSADFVPLPFDMISVVEDGFRIGRVGSDVVNILKFKTLKALGQERENWERTVSADLSDYYYNAGTRLTSDGRYQETIRLYPPVKSISNVQLRLRYTSHPFHETTLSAFRFLPIPPEFTDVVIDGATAIGMEKKGDKNSATKFKALYEGKLAERKRQYRAKFWSDSKEGGRVIYR